MSNELVSTLTAEPNKTYICTRPVTIVLPDGFKPKETAIICLVPKYDSKGVPEYYPVTVDHASDIYVFPSIDEDGKPNTYNDVKFTRKNEDKGFNAKLLGSRNTKYDSQSKGNDGAVWSTSTSEVLLGDPKGTYSKKTRTSILKNSFEMSATVVDEFFSKTSPPVSYITTSKIVMGAVVSHKTSVKIGDITQTYT